MQQKLDCRMDFMENNLTKRHLAPAAQVPGPQFDRNLPFLPAVHAFLLQPHILHQTRWNVSICITSLLCMWAARPRTSNYTCPEFLCKYAHCAPSIPSSGNGPGTTPVGQTVFASAGIRGSKSACCKKLVFCSVCCSCQLCKIQTQELFLTVICGLAHEERKLHTVHYKLRSSHYQNLRRYWKESNLVI